MQNKVYRIATYGGKASGKTCILAALTLTRPANPSGLTCTWIAEKPKSLVPGESLPPDDPYLAGWHWIYSQRELLSNGELPEANPTTNILKYQFNITSPGEGIKSIELIDYSGELILSGDELKDKLKKHMRECDGIMVLAEVPRKNADGTALAIELENLKQAFSSLVTEKSKGAKEDWPIALLLNKWDRLASTAPANAAEAEKGVQEFLSQTPRPIHGQLVDTLTNVVPEGFMKSFAASAFGAHTIGPSGKEIPRLNHGMLESYGLENPLVWLVERADALEARQIAKAVEEASNPINPLQLVFGNDVQAAAIQSGNVFGLSTRKGLAACDSYLMRISGKSPHGRQVKEARSTLRKNGLYQIAMAIFTLFTLINVIGLATDYPKATDVEFILTGKNRTVTQEEVKNAESWALSYAHESTWLRLASQWLILSRSKAETLVKESLEKRDDMAWEEVSKDKSNGNQYELAKRYLADFPAGKHQNEANAIITKIDGGEEDKINEGHLAAVKTQSDQLLLNFTQINELNHKANSLPKPRPLTAKGKELLDQIQINLAERRKEEEDRIKRIAWDKFAVEVTKTVESSSYSEAARLLVERRASKNYPNEEAISSLETLFNRSAEIGIPAKVKDAISRRQWDEARIQANLFNHANILQVMQMPKEQGAKREADLRSEVNQAEDKDIYLDIKKFRAESRRYCDKYLNLPFDGRFKKQVKEYLEYLDKLEGELPIKLTLVKVEIDKDFYNWYGNLNGQISVSVDGKELIRRNPEYLKRGTEHSTLDTVDVSLRNNKRINLKVELRIQQGYIWNADAAVLYTDVGQTTTTVGELNKGLELPIPGSTKPWTNRAHFQITGVPVEPMLP